MKLRRPNKKQFEPLATLEQFAIVDAIWNYTHDITRIFKKRFRVNKRAFNQNLSDLIRLQSKKLRKIIKCAYRKQKKCLNTQHLHYELKMLKSSIQNKLKQHYKYFSDKKCQLKLHRQIETSILTKVIELFEVPVVDNDADGLAKYRNKIYKLVMKYRYYFQYNFMGQSDDIVWGQICQIFNNPSTSYLFDLVSDQIQRDDDQMFTQLIQSMILKNALKKVSYQILQSQIFQYYQQHKQNRYYRQLFYQAIDKPKHTKYNQQKYIQQITNQANQKNKIEKQQDFINKILQNIQEVQGEKGEGEKEGEGEGDESEGDITSPICKLKRLTNQQRQEVNQLANLADDNTTEESSSQESNNQSSEYSDSSPYRQSEYYQQNDIGDELPFVEQPHAPPINLSQIISTLANTMTSIDQANYSQNPSNFHNPSSINGQLSTPSNHQHKYNCSFSSGQSEESYHGYFF